MLSVFHVPYSDKISSWKPWFYIIEISPLKVYFSWTGKINDYVVAP